MNRKPNGDLLVGPNGAAYPEMPGLRLTREQAQRLCGVEATLCRLVLDALVDAKCLCVKGDGARARTTDGADLPRPIEHRRALFDVAVAGPLAGRAVAIPALIIGLQTSTIVPGDLSTTPMIGGTSAGSSVLFALLAKVSLGPALEYGHVLRLSPLAFAGWLGLLVTALNLLPIGQLDGGHIAYSMFGHRIGTVVSTVAMWSLVLLAIFVWPGLTMWAIPIFFVAGTAVPPLNDLTPLTPGRTGLGYASFAILLLILMPLPHALWSAAGLYCPYL